MCDDGRTVHGAPDNDCYNGGSINFMFCNNCCDVKHPVPFLSGRGGGGYRREVNSHNAEGKRPSLVDIHMFEYLIVDRVTERLAQESDVDEERFS